MSETTEPIRSFCSRVINLCTDITDANTLTYIKGLHTVAAALHEEAKLVQSIYGGMSYAGLKKLSAPVKTTSTKPTKKPAKKK